MSGGDHAGESVDILRHDAEREREETMSHESFYSRAIALLEALGPRLDAESVAGVRTLLWSGEEDEAFDELAAMLYARPIEVTVHERDMLRDVFARFRTAPSTDNMHLHFYETVLDVLPTAGVAVRSRGLPPLRGGHEASTDRVGATRFPHDWSSSRIHGAGTEVSLSADATTLPNSKRWFTAVVDDVAIGVLRDAAGAIRVVAPLTDAGPRPRRIRDVALVDHLVDQIHTLSGLVLRNLDGWPDVRSHRALNQLHGCGELDETADAIAAGLLAAALPLSVRVAGYVSRLPHAFDLPVEGCAHLNDRDSVLARLETA